MPVFPLPDPSLDRSDLLAATRYGEMLLSAIEAQSQAGLASDPAMAALVAQMQQIRLALQARDPAAIRRDSGWWGRLLGRDVEAQLQAEQLSAQLGVLLSRADMLAATLRAALVTIAAQRSSRQTAGEAIDRWIELGQQQLGLDDSAWDQALSRRLDHLRRLAVLQHTQHAQVVLLQGQVHELLERYQRIRDVLLPAWQQQATVQAAAQVPTQLREMQRAQDDITAEVTAMQARLR
ncbi:hypothetical protein [Pseudoxanthomonas sp. GM95]|uniref:hypothetical protein n=1 Tax=Pseudoxanthomonas sp. GM95 TaxID=1881043 RepID=UPI001113B8FD|nr:hypothetical protein [Pseudoxanthomonas sp. GM95]